MGKIFNGMLSVICMSVVFLINITSTWVGSAAHMSYSKMYSIMNDNRCPAITRLKIMSFIERLSGPEIGMYCYDLFAMNNWEFYQFLYLFGSNYFLIMSLF